MTSSHELIQSFSEELLVTGFGPGPEAVLSALTSASAAEDKYIEHFKIKLHC